MPRGTAIRRVTPHVLMARLAEPFACSQVWCRDRGAMLVETEAEEGVTGWGEAFGPPSALTAPMVASFAPRLAGRDALTEVQTIADIASGFGTQTTPRAWDAGIAMAVSPHLIAVMPDEPPGLFALQPLLECDRALHPGPGARTPPLVLEDGMVPIPQAPGLGVSPDPAALAYFRA